MWPFITDPQPLYNLVSDIKSFSCHPFIYLKRIHNCDIIYKCIHKITYVNIHINLNIHINFMHISINLFRQRSLDEGAGVKKYSVPQILWILK